MSPRVLIILLCVGLMSLGVLSLKASGEGGEKIDSESSKIESLETDLEILVESSAVVLIAEVQAISNSSQKTDDDNVVPHDTKINLQKELDRAREETSYVSSGLNVGALIHLQTIETLKGPTTEKLSLPNTHTAFQGAEEGDLFLIMMGTTHPDAIRKISSVEDNWVQIVKEALKN